MKCPFCGRDNTRVVDSRPVEDTNSIRRRRMCESCGKRFTTYEKVETIPLSVIKKDQNREPYSRSKVQDGILRACYKRPIPVEKIEEIMDSIEEKSLTGLTEKFPAIRSARSSWNTYRRWTQLLMFVSPPYTENLRMSVPLWKS